MIKVTSSSRRIFIAHTREELERCFPIMHQLRPHLSLQEYLDIYDEAHRQDAYEIVAVEENDQILAVMGYRVLSDFVRGKHIYVDDLVTSEQCRSQGLGADLLQYAEGVAHELGCPTLRLCAVLENERGLQFYDKQGWTKRAFALTKKI